MLRESRPVTLRCGDQLLDLSTPRVMGILNATPDSFYAPSRLAYSITNAVNLAAEMIEQGATILDVGGVSTRPGAQPPEVKEELNRVVPIIEALHAQFPDTIISVDTFRSEVAREAISAGATMVNDISGAQIDPGILEVVSAAKAAYVAMHLRGTPETMSQLTDYEDVTGDILKYFIGLIRQLRQKGIHDILVDPGFGFAKTPEQNYELIRNLGLLNFLQCPILVGVSRKSTLSKTIGRSTDDTLEATTALHMAALLNGAAILRVHDVQAASDTIAVYNRLVSDSEQPE